MQHIIRSIRAMITVQLARTDPTISVRGRIGVRLENTAASTGYVNSRSTSGKHMVTIRRTIVLGMISQAYGTLAYNRTLVRL